MAFFLAIPSILDDVIHIPNRLTPGKTAIAWQHPIINDFITDTVFFSDFGVFETPAKLSNKTNKTPKIMLNITKAGIINKL